MGDWSKIPNAEPFPGAGDKWWADNATPDEKASYEWIRTHAPISSEPVLNAHDGTVVRVGVKDPEWWYRMKNQKLPKPIKFKFKGRA